MRQPLILRIFKGDKLLEVRQFEQDQIIFGRSQGGGEVHLDLEDEAISPIHGLIELRDSGFYICDLGSTTGTFKNDKPILDEPLSSGDRVKVGPYTIHFFVGVPKPTAPPSIRIPNETAVIPDVVTSTSPGPQPIKPAANQPAAPKIVPREPTNEETVIIPPLAPQPSAPQSVVQPPAAPPVAPPPPPTPATSTVAPSWNQNKNDGQNSGPRGAPAISTVSTVAKPGVFTKRSRKTFAPGDQVRLRDSLAGSKGPIVEIVVSWRDRVIGRYFGNAGEKVYIGSTDRSKVIVPSAFVKGSHLLLQNDSNTGTGGAICRVSIPGGAVAEWVGQEKFAQGSEAIVEQGDLLVLSFDDGALQVFIRFVPAGMNPIIGPAMFFSSGEVTGVVIAMVLVALMALYMSVYSPPTDEDKKPEEHVATFIYNKPTPTPAVMPKPPPPPPEPQKVVKEKPTPIPTPEKKKVVKVAEKEKPQEKVGKKDSQAAKSERPATVAAEVRPIPSKVNRPKKFTSVKQGGAVKVGQTEGAAMKTQPDVNSTGLLAAFGGGGTRTQLDKASSGAGDLIGMANKASGKAGQAEDRAGDDIGSKFKDTGAGGKGTSTTGISGINTRGRSSGQSDYGGLGVSGKGNVAIDAGGVEANFQGTIDREAVRRVVRSKKAEIRSCYERALNLDKSIGGKIIVKFIIEEQGRVRQASIKYSNLNNRQVEECVVARIKDAIYPEPPPGTEAEVEYPFVFEEQR